MAIDESTAPLAAVEPDAPQPAVAQIDLRERSTAQVLGFGNPADRTPTAVLPAATTGELDSAHVIAALAQPQFSTPMPGQEATARWAPQPVPEPDSLSGPPPDAPISVVGAPLGPPATNTTATPVITPESPNTQGISVSQSTPARPRSPQTSPIPTPGGGQEVPPPPQASDSRRSGERRPGLLIAAGVGVGVLILLIGAMFSRLFTPEPANTAAQRAAAVAVPPGTITATASSTQDPEGGVTYSAENTLDGRPETAWNSDGKKDGKGPGMVLTYRFAEPVDLASITVLNGYQKRSSSSGKSPVDLFAANSRLRGLRVVTDSGSHAWELQDNRTPQTLTKSFGTTTAIRFEVLSVYPGSKYLDLALSEVSFTAHPAQ